MPRLEICTQKVAEMGGSTNRFSHFSRKCYRRDILERFFCFYGKIYAICTKTIPKILRSSFIFSFGIFSKLLIFYDIYSIIIRLDMR